MQSPCHTSSIPGALKPCGAVATGPHGTERNHPVCQTARLLRDRRAPRRGPRSKAVTAGHLEQTLHVPSPEQSRSGSTFSSSSFPRSRPVCVATSVPAQNEGDKEWLLQRAGSSVLRAPMPGGGPRDDGKRPGGGGPPPRHCSGDGS